MNIDKLVLDLIHSLMVIGEVTEVTDEKGSFVELTDQQMFNLLKETIMKSGYKEKNMPVVMISQPMKGLTNEQIKQNRLGAIASLQEKGYRVLDTVFDYKDVEVNNKPLFYLSKSLELMAAKADVVFFMDGWEQARGCVMEHNCAVAYGIPVLYEC